MGLKKIEMALITIRKSHNQTDLMPLKGRLESEGIPCFLKNEYTTQIMNHMVNFMVELQVLDEDLEKAQALINEIYKED